MSSTAITIDDMHCAACVTKIRAVLDELPFVERFEVNPVRRQIQVSHRLPDGDFQLLAAIERIGFNPRLARQAVADRQDERRARLKRLGVAGICMMQVMMASLALYFGDFWGMSDGAWQLLRGASFLFSVPLVAYCAQPFYESALRSIRGGHLNMDVPIALAILLAFGVSLWHLGTGAPQLYFDSVAMFSFLMLGARYIDGRLKQQISSDDERFAQPAPMVSRWDRDQWVQTSVASICAGDRLLVEEGAALPVDGVLLQPAQIDEASLSGESRWLQKAQGEAVYAGTHNRGARFEMLAQRPASQSRAAQITRLAEQVAQSRSPLARQADRIAAVFVPTVLLLALATVLGGWATGVEAPLSAGLAVLIVSCPCALALAIPAAQSAAMAMLRRQGLLLTDSAVLEQAPEITQVYFDKTGTLTLPDLSIAETTLLADWSEDQCLKLAQALQQHSTHPIARAFTRFQASQDGVCDIEAVQVVTGRGIEGTCDGHRIRMGSADFCGLEQGAVAGRIYLSRDRRALAAYRLDMAARPDLPVLFERLRSRNITLSLLSGDHASTCAEFAKPLRLDYASAQSPEDKLAHLKSHKGPSDRTLFVGDGINDGPAFAGADVAIATLETSDLVRARASAMLLSTRLTAIADLIDMGHRCRRVMRQNLGWAALYNLIAIPAAMLGWMPPWLAAIGMASSSTLVLLNASRLLGTVPLQARTVANGDTEVIA